MIDRVRHWLTMRREQAANQHRSNWDNPITGNDLLQVFAKTDRARKRRKTA